MIAVQLSFSDDPDRMAGRPAHRERLRQLHADGQVLAAGPWADDTGALVIFTGDRAEVDRLLAEDPYYRGPGVTVESVREWAPVFRPS